jgi:hypothetical protein
VSYRSRRGVNPYCLISIIKGNFKMKLFILSASFAILALVGAAPTPTENGDVQRANIVKRATITDVADSGYATQNGG